MRHKLALFSNLVRDSCLTHVEMFPVAGSQETSSEVVVMRGTNVLGTDPAFSLRHRNHISAIWGLESQAEPPNTSFTAKWNGHVFLGSGEKPQEATSLWNPRTVPSSVLYRRELIPFPAAV